MCIRGIDAEISIDPVWCLQSMQRNIIKSRCRKIAPVGAEMSDGSPIRSDVDSVCRDGHRRREVRLLPARSGLASKCYGCEKSAGGAPQAAHVGAGVS